MEEQVKLQSIAELISLKGKTAVVTGGMMGIGWAVVHRLAQAGANIIIADIRIDLTADAIERLRDQYGIKVDTFQADVSDSNVITSLLKTVFEQSGRIDILINNAGIYPLKNLLEVTDTDYDKVIDLNQRGTFVASREAAKYMIQGERGGVIINIAGSAAVKTTGNSVHYIASKHAIIGLTKSFAKELGSSGIRVLAVAPSLINTPGIDKLREDSHVDEGMRQYAHSLPLGRIGDPDDVAKVVLFAACGLSGYMTGSAIFVDGGEFSL